MLKDSIEGVYRIERPRGPALPLVFDSPHSGRTYPADFRFACPGRALKAAEDNDVDDLFSCAPDYGAALLCAEFPRTYIDPNREETDIDPVLLDDPPEGLRPTSRSHAGIGLVRRIVRPGLPLYDRKLDRAEIEARIETYYRPYHAALDALIDRAHYDYGVAWHVNCHSMPGGPGSGTAPHFVLGDRDGTSCCPAFVAALRDFIAGMGYRVALNNPYKGVELVRRHGHPARGRNSVQIEVSKSLYWNEAAGRRGRNYAAVKHDITRMVAFCADYAASGLTAIAAD